MKILVAYASRLGSTKEIAERIAARLRSHGVEATARPAETVAELTGYEAFVIGSGVYAGHWLSEATEFVGRHSHALSAGPVWLFSSGPVGRLATTTDPVEPSEVGELKTAVGARDHRIFAGALDRRTVDAADLGRVERFVAKRFIPEGDFRDWPQIEAWADDIANELMAAPADGR